MNYLHQSESLAKLASGVQQGNLVRDAELCPFQMVKLSWFPACELLIYRARQEHQLSEAKLCILTCIFQSQSMQTASLMGERRFKY